MFCCNDHDDAVQMRQLHAEVGVVAKADGLVILEQSL
jgi:hypothetical protein